MFVGGRLSPEWLLDAYRHGIFPWPLIADYPQMLWWSPDPRGVMEYDDFYCSKRLARTLRQSRFRVTSDRAFAEVLAGCAMAQDRADATWLTPEMRAAYGELHNLGYAHSVEVWLDDELVGGTYGVAVGGVFSAESMFHTATDASKVALATLLPHLRKQGFVMVDIQQLNSHTESLGGTEIPRRDYLQRLGAALRLQIKFGEIGETTSL
ncbi:MAG: leucyl/phenylalanyl-tRNA--protein transferase [Pirellulales bacterium]